MFQIIDIFIEETAWIVSGGTKSYIRSIGAAGQHTHKDAPRKQKGDVSTQTLETLTSPNIKGCRSHKRSNQPK